MRLPLAARSPRRDRSPPCAADFPPPDKLPANPELPDPTRHARRHEGHHEGRLGSEAPARAEGAVRALHVRPLSREAREGHGEGAVRGRQGARRQGHAPRSGDHVRPAGVAEDLPARRGAERARRRRRASSARTSAATTCRPTDERVHIPTVVGAGPLPRRGEEQGDRRRAAASRPMCGRWSRSSSKGYAVATFYCGDIQPDRPNVREGMRAHAADSDRRTPGDETATIMWWAWGCHRAVDYLVTDKSIDAKRMAVVGPLAARQDGAAGRGVRRPHRGGDPAPVRLRRRRAEPHARTRRPRR